MIRQFFAWKVEISVFAVLAVLAGCRKDEITFIAYTPTAESLNTVLMSAPAFQSTSAFNFSGAVPDTILSTADGYKVHLTDTETLFADDSGKLVPCSSCNTLRVEIESATQRGTIIAKGLSTLDASGRLLEAGGTLKFSANCQGKKLQLHNNRSLKVEGPEITSNDKFFLFEAPDFGNSIFGGWSSTGQEAIPVQSTSSTAFSVELKQLGWLNLGRYLPGATRACYALLPAEYSGDNTRVYFVSKKEVAVAPMIYVADKRFFRLNTAPLNSPAQIVTISKMSNGWRFFRKDIDLNTQTSFGIIPKEVTEKQLIEQLAAL